MAIDKWKTERIDTFWNAIKISIPGTEKLLDSVKQLTNTQDKINAIYQYVRQQTSWNKFQSMYPGDINEAWKNKTGNSAAINIIIFNLLNNAGVVCYPNLISTRENGKTDPRFPHISQFNGLDVLAFDSANYYVLDGSVKNQSFLIPPLNVLNRDVFLILPDNYKWINITESRPLIKDSIYVTAVLNKEGDTKGETVATSFNLSKNLRLSENSKDDGADKLAGNEAPELKTDSTWMINKDNDMLPLVEHVQFHSSLATTNNFYFLSPLLFNFMRKNPFTDTARTTDIDFLCNQQYVQNIKLIMPAEIILETIPKSITIRTADTSFIYSRTISQRGSVLSIQNEFIINKSQYSSEDYLTVREFFKKVYGLLAEDIVFTKKP